MKILIVDDQDMIRKLVVMTLTNRNDEIAEVDNGSDVLPMIDSFKPDLVVLDVMMPGAFDGFDLCRKIKSNPETNHIKVVMLTAKALDDDKEEAKYAGADEYLVKPFSPINLITAVEKFEKQI
ncbi:response regulator [Thiosulfativibrio zosterae]|uniref:Response regulator n=1 Tax=Thiosulfativibrio zosterae TaxID=2675053 RepID=A0A6F8PL90_9GAMM|nr:response regulator [Thiosulfativibrio zosterae]BBP42855.1 response regulator [Thiosulfativibrio zosterae]